ncbi:MAG: hypothetical protein E7199_04600 [Schwartzia succinivorans]|nr:hypothetical protein [Schwartzia succinivorans]
MAKILPKEPIGEDLFESKSQENIASSIIEQIDGLHLIGIEGGWGTGKSNLVKIIEKKINKNEQGTNYSFYIYDAWGHQEDSHRRSLIEELVEYVADQGIIQSNALNSLKEKKNEILGAVITTTTKISSGFSWATFFLFCAMVSTPITVSLGSLINEKSWVQSILSFLPLIFVVIALLFAGYSSFKNSNKGFWDSLKDELIGAYNRGDTEQEKTEYTNTSNPSTASVKAFFRTLSENLPSNTVLIIVIDNLDRLSAIKVQDIWATVQICFAGDNKLNNIKVLVPFDRDHLKENLLEEKDYIDDYLNKTFDVVFRVAPPVLSDWEGFFVKQWEDAFGRLGTSEEKAEFDYVKRIYDAYTRRITPRDIISFINECVAIKMMNLNIKYRYVAVFVKKKDDILTEIVKKLSDLSYLTPLEYLFRNDESFSKSIAALAYQVSLDQGMEVAVRRILQQALVGNNVAEVSRIAEIKAFPSLLGEVLEDITEPEEVCKSICALENVAVDKFGGEELFYARWNMLLKKVGKASEEVGNSLQDYQKILLEKVGKGDKERYVQHLLRSWYDEKQISAINLSYNLDVIDKIVSQSGIDVWGMLEEYEVDLDQFKPFVEKYNKTIYKYNISCDEKVVDEYLASLPLKDLENVNYVSALKDEKHGLKYDLEKYTNKLQESMKTDSGIQIYNILITRLKEVLDVKDENNHIIDIGQLANIGVLANYMQVAKNDDAFNELVYDFLAIALVKFDFNTLKSQSAFSEYVTNNDTELAQKVSACIEYYMDYGDILLRAEVMKQSVLYQRVCQLLTTKDHKKEQYLNILQIVPKFETIVDSTGISKHDLAQYLSLWETDGIEKLEKSKVEQVITKSFLNYTNDIFDNNLVSATQKRALQYLSDLSQEEWKAYLQQGMEVYGLSIGLSLHFKWTDSAMFAVKEFFEETVKEHKILGRREEWDMLIVSLKESGKSLKPTFGNVYDHLKDKPISIDEFKFWADWIFEEDVISPEESTLRRFIPEKLLDDSSCVEIMLRHREQVKEIYRAAGDEQSDFKNQLIHLIDTQSKNKKEDNKEPDKAMKNLSELAQALNIDVTSASEESNNDD